MNFWTFADRRRSYERGLMIRGVAAAAFLGLFWGVKAAGIAGQIPALDWLESILILLIPRLLNYVVALYLILVGIIGLWPRFIHHIPH